MNILLLKLITLSKMGHFHPDFLTNGNQPKPIVFPTKGVGASQRLIVSLFYTMVWVKVGTIMNNKNDNKSRTGCYYFHALSK